MDDKLLDELSNLCKETDTSPILFLEDELNEKYGNNTSTDEELQEGKEALKDFKLLEPGEALNINLDTMLTKDNMGVLDESADAALFDLNLIDMDKIIYGDDDDSGRIMHGIVDKQKRGYNDLKKSENPYTKEFAEEITMLYDCLNDVDKFDKSLNKRYTAATTSKTKGISKTTGDLINSILTCKSNKIQIIKEITAIKKTIQDLSLKDEKRTKDNGGNSADLIANNFLKGVMNYGRNNFIENSTKMMSSDNNYDNNIITGSVNDFNNLNEDEVFGNLDRSETLDAYVKYEALEPKVCIKRYIDTGDWEFFALDKYGNEIPDYPLPEKGKISFNEDYTMGTDKIGLSYRVEQLYSGNDIDN